MLHSTLSEELKYKNSSIRTYLGSSYPNIKNIQKEFREEIKKQDFLNDKFGDPIKAGIAFENMIKFYVNPYINDDLTKIFYSYKIFNKNLDKEMEIVKKSVQENNIRQLAISCFMLSHITLHYRVGNVTDFIYDVATSKQKYAEWSDKYIYCSNDIDILVKMFNNNLQNIDTIDSNSVFHFYFKDYLKVIKMEADLVSKGRLIDIKTILNPSLSNVTIYQIISYALADFRNEYQIEKIGLFYSRFQFIKEWNLNLLLSELSNKEIDVQEERYKFLDMIQKSISIV